MARYKKGLGKNELKELQELIEIIDFDDVFGVDDLKKEAFLKNLATEKQMQKIWAGIEKNYGRKRFREVMQDKYSEE